MTVAMFWFLSILLVLATVAALCWPLLRADARGSDADAGNIAVYKDQLAEVDADLDRGLLSESEAAAARTEISRRLLAVADNSADHNEASEGGGQSSWMTWAPIAAAIPLIAVPLYLSQGKPGQPGVPYAERIAKTNGDDRINSLIARVEARLRSNPDDGRGWDVIAPVYFGRQEFRKSANAYARSLQLNGPSPKRLMGLGESIVFANDEIVTEPARVAFEKVVELDAKAIKARFWLALAKEQDGRINEAIAGYRQLLSEGSPEDNWFNMLSNRVFSLQRQAKLESGEVRLPGPSDNQKTNTPPTGPRVANAPAQPGPTQDDIKAAQSMSQGDRMAMINTMVEGLAEKLGDNSTDSAGWLRLIRSYVVLGRRDDATAALARARTIFKDNETVQAQLTQLATGLKLQ